MRSYSLKTILSFLILIILPFTSIPAFSEPSKNFYKEISFAVASGNWFNTGLINLSQDKISGKIITWLALIDDRTHPNFQIISEFLYDNPDWPCQDIIRRKAEMALNNDIPDIDITKFFNIFPPLTAKGSTYWIRTLQKQNKLEAAIESARTFWIEGSFGSVEEKDFLKSFSSFLRTQDHAARLDRLLWFEQLDAAKRLLPLVDPRTRAISQTRLKLASLKPNAEKDLKKVEVLLIDPPAGLLYEQLRWYRRHNYTEKAVYLLQHLPPIENFYEKWWLERSLVVRQLIDQKSYALAYEIVKDHGLPPGPEMAEAEFLAGWLSLRKLNKPRSAVEHFERLYNLASFPITKARGAYWTGRALEALNRLQQAHGWYVKAAVFKTTFYGQLAAQHLHHSGKLDVSSPIKLSEKEREKFAQQELVQAADFIQNMQLHDVSFKEDWSGLLFRRAATKTDDSKQLFFMAEKAQAWERPDLAIFAAKEATAAGTSLGNVGYPVLDIPIENVDLALIHALIRQESTFFSSATSQRGAQGLMQLMPATARSIAHRLGLKHTNRRLTEDMMYNLRIGTAYIKLLEEKFNGSIVLTVAAYNAGPTRVGKWISDYGNPTSLEDIVDWIEVLPAAETRNYIQRVLEAIPIYKAILNKASAPYGLEQLLLLSPSSTKETQRNAILGSTQ